MELEVKNNLNDAMRFDSTYFSTESLHIKLEL